jgi:hypothetical protein
MALRDFPGPRAGDRVPDIPLEAAANNGAARLFDLLRGTGHHLLLFEGDRPSAAVHESLPALALQVHNRFGSWIVPRIVIGNDGRMGTRDCNLPIIRDVDHSLHHRFGGGATCLYLIRPDGYVGYRSASADAGHFWEYVDRLLVTS